MVCPIVAVPTLACLSMLIHGLYVKDTDTVSVSEVVPPTGSVPVAVAVLLIGPGRSLSCTVCVAVPDVLAPGFSVVVPSDIDPSLLSITVIPVRVTSPQLVTV